MLAQGDKTRQKLFFSPFYFLRPLFPERSLAPGHPRRPRARCPAAATDADRQENHLSTLIVSFYVSYSVCRKRTAAKKRLRRRRTLMRLLLFRVYQGGCEVVVIGEKRSGMDGLFQKGRGGGNYLSKSYCKNDRNRARARKRKLLAGR